MKDRFTFSDPRDITVGAARIVWASRLRYDGYRSDMQGVTYPAGWVLPGGTRTQSKEEAEQVASTINTIIMQTSKSQVATMRSRAKP